MKRRDESHPAFADCFFQFADDIAVRPHIFCVPGIDFARPHRKAVVVLRHRPGELRTRFFEEVRPFIGVELLRLEHRHKIRIPELVRLAVCLDVMLVFRRVYVIHIPRIPFVAERGHGVNAPVKIYPEFRVAEPLGRRITFLQRNPVRRKNLLSFAALGFLAAILTCAAV